MLVRLGTPMTNDEAPAPKKLAYIGSAMNMDRGCCVVWAETRGKAKALAASELDVAFNELDSLKREPRLDGFDGDLMQWMLDEGWSFPCGHCERNCCGGNGLRVGENMYCDQDHADEAAAREKEYQRERAYREAKAEELKRLAAELRPGSIVHGAYWNEYGGVINVTLPSGRQVSTSLDWLASEEGQKA